ncbi:MAG: VOC family protein [Planctomycetota bacterium]|nr:VOC family protein [Planctomycetota bacterium]
MSDADKGSEKQFPIANIAQICILVPDLDKTIRNFYHRFGIGPWTIYTYDDKFVPKQSRYGKPAKYSSRIGLANVGPMRIELIQPLEGETVYTEFIGKHGYGVQHLGVLTENMAESLRQAGEAGLAMTMDGSGFGLDGDGHYAYLDTEDLVGITFELIERPKGRRTPEGTYP